MARITALVDAVSTQDERPHSLISHFGRTIRDAGLIRSKKTGTGASEMTVEDAATMLMAVCGALGPVSAVEAVNNLRGLEPRGVRVRPDNVDQMKRKDLPPKLRFLRKAGNFGEMVALLIERADDLARWEEDYLEAWRQEQGPADSEAEFSMERMVRKLDPSRDPIVPGYARALRVVFYPPGIAAEVHLGRTWKALEEDNAFHELFWSPKAPAFKRCDVLPSIEIGTPTLQALLRAVQSPSVVPRKPRKAVRG